ncbi:hypothetical protein B566_EDAN008375 [Ephemera danica]|nr:hypothetical protein B566_EDAN008375 [Ephemera danica]
MWSLVCSREMLVNVIQHFYLEGIFFGGIVTFLLLKKLSPRVVLVTGAILQIAAGLGLAFAPYYEIHMALKMLTGLGACVMFSAGFQICWDITNGWQRIVICVCYEHFWSIGVISLGWLSDIADSWVNLQVIISVPTVLILLLIQFVPDSPRWFIAAGKLEQAEKILRRGASFNNRDLALEFEIKPTSGATTSSPKLHMARVVALGVIWIITVVHYYGGLLNMRSNGGPRLPARTSLAGLAEVIGAMIGMILLFRCRPMLKFAFLSSLLAIGGTACVSSWALNPTRGGGRSGWPMLWMALAGRISIACSLAVMSCGGCAELIPLPRRPLTMLTLVSLARMVLTSAPFINSLAQYGESVTLSIYGVMCLSGAAAACYLAVDLLLEQKKQRASEKQQNLLATRPSIFYTKQIQRNSIFQEHNILGVYFSNPCFINDDNDYRLN